MLHLAVKDSLEHRRAQWPRGFGDFLVGGLRKMGLVPLLRRIGQNFGYSVLNASLVQSDIAKPTGF